LYVGDSRRKNRGAAEKGSGVAEVGREREEKRRLGRRGETDVITSPFRIRLAFFSFAFAFFV
jgi:hypothetical protein